MATAVAGFESIGREARVQWGSTAERNITLFGIQRHASRGPTPEVLFTKHIDNSRIVKADDPARRREMRQFAAVTFFLFLLMMVYVKQHVSAIETGYDVEAQKAQVSQLEEQNRQLQLSEAQLTDPGRIDRIARQMGLDEPQPGQVVQPDGSLSGSAALAQAVVPEIK